MRMPTSGISKIEGAGDVLAGRVEQSLSKLRMLLNVMQLQAIGDSQTLQLLL